MNPKVGRAVLCAPRMGKDRPWFKDGAHGVTRPTSLRFRGPTRKTRFWGILNPGVRAGVITNFMPASEESFSNLLFR